MFTGSTEKQGWLLYTVQRGVLARTDAETSRFGLESLERGDGRRQKRATMMMVKVWDPELTVWEETKDDMFLRRMSDFRFQIKEMLESFKGFVGVEDDYYAEEDRKDMNNVLDSAFRKLQDTTTDTALAEAIRLEL